MKIDLRRTDDLSARERRELDELEVRCFGPPEQHQQALRLIPAPAADTKYVVRVWESDRLVSCLWITERTILVDGRNTCTAGIRGVRTDPACRRRGYGRAAMERATDFIRRELRPELALLISSQMAVPFYRTLGWETIEGPVLCEQPDGTINLTEAFPENPAMVVLPAGGQLPRGTVDLCGYPW